jgi:hypothetical protein
MANVKLVFTGTKSSRTERDELVIFAIPKEGIYLSIEMYNTEPSFICLDKPTAVRLVRELKKQIGCLESEVNNG